MAKQFKPSNRLSATENRRLEVLKSCLYAAPLLDASYAEYADLCKKAHRKAKPNW